MVKTLSQKKKPAPKPDLRLVDKTGAIINPPSTHNGPDYETVVFWGGRIEDAEAGVARERAVLNRVKKQAENAGVMLGIMSDFKKQKAKGTATLVKYFQTFIHYAKAHEEPIGQQLSLFENPADRSVSHETLLIEAFNEGRILGLLAKDTDDQKYPPNSDLGQEHMRGWHDGQDVYRKRLVQNSEDMAAQTKKAADEKAAKAQAKTDKAEKAEKKAKGPAAALKAVKAEMAKLKGKDVEDESASEEE